MVLRLREVAGLYSEFLRGRKTPQIGALVTPRADSPLCGAGRPHIVIDRRAVATEPDRRSMLKTDVRIAYLDERDEATIQSVWVESWWLERWTPAHAAMSRPSEGSA